MDLKFVMDLFCSKEPFEKKTQSSKVDGLFLYIVKSCYKVFWWWSHQHLPLDNSAFCSSNWSQLDISENCWKSHRAWSEFQMAENFSDRLKFDLGDLHNVVRINKMGWHSVRDMQLVGMHVIWYTCCCMFTFLVSFLLIQMWMWTLSWLLTQLGS